MSPPFSEYVSGHRIFSATGAEVLKRFTESDVFGFSAAFAAGSSRVEPGLVPAHDLVLTWATFSDAADEAGISRRYGGIHFKDGDLNSRQMDRLVSAQAYAKASSYWNPGNWRKASQVSDKVYLIDAINKIQLRRNQRLAKKLADL